MDKIFTHISTLLLGLFAGAMLLIGIGLLPYWNSLEPLEFTAWFSNNSHFIGNLMIPLGGSSVLLTVVATVIAYKRHSKGWRWLALASVAALFSGALYPLYYTEANASLQSMTLVPTEIVTELNLWGNWHWTRTVLGMIAFIAASQSIFARTSGVNNA